MAERTNPPAAVLDFNEKNFRPSVVETELYDWWERSGFFTPPDRPSRDEKRFVMMLPLPNVTGDLHMGHALGFGGYTRTNGTPARPKWLSSSVILSGKAV